jgi:hypothetical protein
LADGILPREPAVTAPPHAAEAAEEAAEERRKPPALRAYTAGVPLSLVDHARVVDIISSPHKAADRPAGAIGDAERRTLEEAGHPNLLLPPLPPLRPPSLLVSDRRSSKRTAAARAEARAAARSMPAAGPDPSAAPALNQTARDTAATAAAAVLAASPGKKGDSSGGGVGGGGGGDAIAERIAAIVLARLSADRTRDAAALPAAMVTRAAVTAGATSGVDPSALADAGGSHNPLALRVAAMEEQLVAQGALLQALCAEQREFIRDFRTWGAEIGGKLRALSAAAAGGTGTSSADRDAWVTGHWA